jgi:hypothetical protein
MKNLEALKQRGEIIWNIAKLLRAPYLHPIDGD